MRGMYKRPFKFNTLKPVHRFSRGYSALAVSGSAAFSPAYLEGLVTQLNFLPNFTEFTNLYDEYRIDWVQFKFYLPTEFGPQTTGNSNQLLMHWCIDTDDAGVPANLDAIRQHSNAKTALLTTEQPIIIGYKPMCSKLVYRPGVTSAYASEPNCWVDCESTDVPHYGLKFGLEDFTNTLRRIRVEARVWVSLRGAR